MGGLTQLFPNLVTARFLDVTNVLILILILFLNFQVQQYEQRVVYFWRIYFTIGRFFQCFLCGNPVLCGVLQFVISVFEANIIRFPTEQCAHGIYSFDSYKYAENEHFGGLGHSSLFSDLPAQVLTWAALIIITCALDFQMVTAAANHIEAENSDLSRRLGLQLLNGICDAIAELDESFAISGSTTKLAAVLLRRNSAPLEGLNFLSLIATHDHDRFLRYVEHRKAQGIDEVALPLKVDLVDSIGNSVPVHLTCTSLLRSSCRGGMFCIGISADEEPWHQHGLLKATMVDTDENPTTNQLGTCSIGSSYHSSAFSDSKSLGASVPNLSFEFNLRTGSITRYSPDFQDFVGYGHTDDAMRLIHDEWQRQRFANWLKDACSSIQDAREALPVRKSPEPMNWEVRGGCNTSRRHLYNVNTAVEFPAGDIFASQYVVKLSVISYKRLRAGGSSRSRLQTGLGISSTRGSFLESRFSEDEGRNSSSIIHSHCLSL